MNGWPDKPQQWIMIDFPASYHAGSGGWPLLMGIQKFIDGETPGPTPPIGKLGGLNVSSPKNP
jgi:hypothetical protein